MLPFNAVESCTAWPQKCAGCHGSTGPFVDTKTEWRAPGAAGAQVFMRIYLCKRCVEWSMAALELDARDELGEVRRENDELTEQLGRAVARLHSLENVDELVERVTAIEERLAPTTAAA